MIKATDNGRTKSQTAPTFILEIFLPIILSRFLVSEKFILLLVFKEFVPELTRMSNS